MNTQAQRYLAQIIRNTMMAIFLAHPDAITFNDLYDSVRDAGTFLSKETLAQELVELMNAGYLDMTSDPDDFMEDIFITLTEQGVAGIDELMI